MVTPFQSGAINVPFNPHIYLSSCTQHECFSVPLALGWHGVVRSLDMQRQVA
jgi:hypothetical protein